MKNIYIFNFMEENTYFMYIKNICLAVIIFTTKFIYFYELIITIINQLLSSKLCVVNNS